MKQRDQRRRQAGAWLRQLRETAGLTQVELARRLGFKYYAFISQVETGISRVPTDKLEAWAQALDADPSEFTKRLISFYEPELHRLLYEARSRRMHPLARRARLHARQVH
jgi:transcriptional regulator with XRE-family HTH domain